MWFRDLVPPHQSLLFYDDGFNAYAELAAGMSVEQLAEQYYRARG